MTKDAISDFSVTANSNTDIIGVNIDEGCPPSSLNNGIRALMKTLADLNAGNSSLGTLKVDNLQLDANAITSTDTNGNITITPHGTGSVSIDGLTYPTADGSSGQLLKTNGSGVLSFVTGYVHPNHSGEVTSTADGATVIADNVVDEANLKVSNAPTNGYFLSAQSGNTGGLTWAEAGGGGFSFNAVTGATPSLNLGTYNFFDRGATSANTTVSFASVPTEARWTYTFEVGGGTETYEVDNANFEKSFSILNQDGDAKDIFFKSDGTEMYVIGAINDNVNQYTLSTAWDVSTASYTRAFDVSSQEATPLGLFFKSDGTEMYVCGSTGDDVNQYTLSTAWNISTASYTRVFDVSSQDTSPKGLFFKTDGTEMYVVGDQGNDINQYTLSTAWNISTASYTRLFYTATQAGNPEGGLFFKSDGTIMYQVGSQSDGVYQYALSTGWDISSASYSKFVSVTVEDYDPKGLFFKSDGSKMYIVGALTDSVLQYNMGIPHTLTLPSSVENPPRIPLQFGSRYAYDFFTKDGGTTVTLISENQSGTAF